AGRRGFYMHRDYADYATAPWRGRTVLLSPFDNLIADRVRNRSLFGFDFAIEIYVPAAKRKRGYYAFPILSGDRLVGSADLKFDRAARRLVVQKLMFEEGLAMTPAVQRAIDELESFVRRKALTKA
ncbi:MAG TPA: crosslink repair DNA glycosylase YcaQ family protein, partial [Candidatus Dormibacteraeota bacterium]|nr:crosslink repair DNA glycosylase YcaQ family protein [Candidatus Dormibacteraeota bacterium]